MIEMLTRLSPISADAFLLSILIALVMFVAVPIGVTFYMKHERRRRRKLVNSPRRIGLASDEVEARPCEHLRSRSRARQSADGRFVSICKKCGVPMVRVGAGDWIVAPQGLEPQGNDPLAARSSRTGP